MHLFAPTISPVAGPRPASPRVPVSERVLAALASAACLALLILSARLDPEPAGHGTHTQLGLPACGWVIGFGRPCPTCGMTTAFAHAAHGRLWSSLVAQPAGAFLALLTACGVWIGAYIAATGSRVGRLCARMLAPRWLWAFAGLAAASWAYKLATWPTG